MAWLLWSALAIATATWGAPAQRVIRFDGNRALPTAALADLAQRLGPTLDDDDGPERLALAMTALYFDRGYVMVRIDDPVRASDGALVFHVDEGEPFSVGTVTVSGTTPRRAARLRASLRTHAGDVFCRARVVADVAQLSAKTHLAVTPLTRLDVEHHIVNLELALTP
jgi:outer membrane protein assembly factor BamA